MDFRIKELLKERGLTSLQLAGMLGVSAVSVSSWINGRFYPSVEMLEKIATALGVEVGDLFRSAKNVAYCPHCGKPIELKRAE